MLFLKQTNGQAFLLHKGFDRLFLQLYNSDELERLIMLMVDYFGLLFCFISSHMLIGVD